MKHVFITGAAGFIGGYAVREFVEQGWHVFALIHKRTSADLESLVREGSVTLIRGDITDLSTLEKAIERAGGEAGVALDVILHCAGRASDVGWRREFRRTNFESVQHLVECTKRFDVGRFVFVSTTDVYGLRDFIGQGEDDLPLHANVRNPYPEFKIAAEEWIREELSPERFAIVRPAEVWGVGDPTLTPRIVGFLRHSPWIVHFGKWRGRNRWPLAHVRNVAVALFLAATLPETGGQAINVLDSETTSIDEFYRILAAVFLPGKEFRNIVLPLWVGGLVGRVVSGISNLLNLTYPFADPSLYALLSVSNNLDFSNGRMRELFEKGNRIVLTKEKGIEELQNESFGG